MNISELAEELSLSVTTVSRALSGQGEKYRVSKATIQRVCEAAERNQVSPDPLGAGLQRGTLGMIALLVPDITNPFFSSLARSIELELRQKDIMVQLCDSAEDELVEIELLEQIVKRKIDGLIIAPVGKPSARFEELLRVASFPIVMVDRILPGFELPSVSLDNVSAGRLAAQHLLDNGHRKIACLRGDRGSFNDRERFRGVMEALDDASVPVYDNLVKGDGYTRDAGMVGASEILNQDQLPDAVISLNGQGILGILEVASDLGIKIPEDISVIAFDEQPWSALVSPALTTIEQPVSEIAIRAAGMIQAKKGDLVESPVLKAKLRERGSVGLR